MAIQFARVQYVSRSAGGNACLKAAYNERNIIKCERTGQVFNFKSKSDLFYHEILLPEGVSDKFKDSTYLWNAAENAERRKDSQVQKESVIALPDNKEISHEDRIEIAKRYAYSMFVSKGLAAQIDIHSPHDGEKNWHAHVLATTRGFTNDGLSLSPYKSRETDPLIKKGYIQKEMTPGELYSQIQNDYFKEKGLDIRVDPTNIIGEKHIGPVRMRKHMGDALERANLLKEANEEAIRTPSEILKKLTRHQATFSEKDLDILLNKHLDQDEIVSVKEKIFADPDLLRLHDKTTKEETPFWTTKTVRSEEEKLLRFVQAINEKSDKRADRNVIIGMLEASSLTSEQKAAVEHATIGTKGLAIIEGRAGTGKSFTMGHIRNIYEQSRYMVIGLAPTNQVVQDMKKDGFSEAHTVHSFLFKQKNGRLPSLNKDTILIVDEAAMLGNSALVELFNCAKNNELKVVLFGDDRQLSSVERGGMFPELISAFGSKELTEVRRQSGWHKEASEMLSQRQGKETADLLEKKKAIQWSLTKEDCLKQLVEDWARDSVNDLDKDRLILVSRNVDVDALNQAVREVRLQRGEIAVQGYICQTSRGKETFSVNDRVCLTQTDKNLGLSNGSFAIIKELDEKRCTLDLGEGKEVSFDPNTYQGLRLGYAATVYKSQGKSIPDIYALHDPHAGSQLNYVALTRHKESLKVYVNQEETKSLHHFAAQLTRERGKRSSLQYLTQEQVQAYEKQGERERIHSFWQSVKNTVKNYLSDTFHKNEEFYQFKDKNAGKEETFLPVQKAKEEEQNIAPALPQKPAPVQKDWAKLIAEKEKEFEGLTVEQSIAKAQRQIAGTDELYEKQQLLEKQKKHDPKKVAYENALNSKDPAKVIEYLLKANPDYNVASDMVDRVGKAYAYLKDIAVEGSALSDKDNLHLLKQCLYGVGESLIKRKIMKDRGSVIGRNKAEETAWLNATRMSRTDSLKIEISYKNTTLVQKWEQAAQSSTTYISCLYPHMDKGLVAALVEESLRVANLLPKHTPQAREFILERGKDIQEMNHELLKQAVNLTSIQSVKGHYSHADLLQNAKSLIVKEKLMNTPAASLAQNINIEAKQEQQRLNWYQDKMRQEERQHDLQRQFTR